MSMSDIVWSQRLHYIQNIGPCEEVTASVGFDLFRLKKLNKRDFNDIVLNMISKQ